MSKQGLLLTFEGGEGSGKSTAVKNLGKWFLVNYGIVPIVTREPGGTKIGEEIRNILLENGRNIDPVTESFLFQAARAQLVKDIIEPSLLQNMIVIIDRFADSSIVYQGIARDVGINKIKNLNDMSTHGIVPDITFLMDVDPKVGLKRKKDRGKLDRIDSEGSGFHDRVRDAYLKEAGRDETGRWIVIDASLPEEIINEKIQIAVESKIRQNGFLEKHLSNKER